MTQQSYHFDAFISYRHTQRDKNIVDKIQKLAEKYRSPCDGAYIKKGQRIQRIFTDRSELPMSTDLGASIRQALEQSRFLLVIASPEYMQSRWCMEELRSFLRYNQNSTDRILFVHAGGPPSCVTDILSAAGVRVEEDSFREPLYIDASAPTIKESVKIIKREYLRLVAVLIGCSYDALYQRHKRALWTKCLVASSVVLLIGAIVGGLFANQAQKRKQEADYRAMESSITAIEDLLRSEERMQALEQIHALYQQYGHKPAYAEYLAQKLETTALRACYVPAFSAFHSVPAPAESVKLQVSSDEKYVIMYDCIALREEGKLKIFLYDAYLNELAQYVLAVEQWKDEILYANGFDASLRIDYHQAEGTFEIELLYHKAVEKNHLFSRTLLFSQEGQLLEHREVTAGQVAASYLAVRQKYQTFLNTTSRPSCFGQDRMYTFLTEGESGYDAFGPKGEMYYVISASGDDDDVSLIATLERFSDIYALDDIYITSDERFVLVEETRGIYNDVLTVCDTYGLWDTVRIDMGSNHRICDMLYRFDIEKLEAQFLFNLGIAGEENAQLLALCRVRDGQLLSCEMYQSTYISSYAMNSQGLIYIVNDAQVKIITTQNMCLPDRMANTDVPVRTDRDDNDMFVNKDATSISTGDFQNIRVKNLTIRPDIARFHYYSPDLYSGYEIGIGIDDDAGNEVLRFYATDFQNTYYNRKDNVFGLLNYSNPESYQVFRLYDFYSLMEVLSETDK